MWSTIIIISSCIAYSACSPAINNSYRFLPIARNMSATREAAFSFGSCTFIINPICPDPFVTFYLYSKSHPEQPEPIRIGSDPMVSNLTDSAFDPTLPTKIIIHGYNSDMFLSALTEIRKEYLATNNFNVFAVDWSPLVQSPCYLGAVWNARHAGTCSSQLVQRIRELGSKDIHVIGFSLGAHVANYLAVALRPYKLPRITGLDPALPGFITPNADEKLDKSDADFVDIFHTNVFVQGKVEESGHVDFYMNGGIIQPGCWAENRFFACNHHRAPLYFAESINTAKGFWGWPCPNYLQYLLGRCPVREPQIIMGEHIDRRAKGVYLVITESVSPFAVGKFTGPLIEIFVKSESSMIQELKQEILKLVDEDNVLNETMYSNTSLKDVLNEEFANDIFV